MSGDYKPKRCQKYRDKIISTLVAVSVISFDAPPPAPRQINFSDRATGRKRDEAKLATRPASLRVGMIYPIDQGNHTYILAPIELLIPPVDRDDNDGDTIRHLIYEEKTRQGTPSGFVVSAVAGLRQSSSLSDQVARSYIHTYRCSS